MAKSATSLVNPQRVSAMKMIEKLAGLHLSGAIQPHHTLAWECMVWRQSQLEKIRDAYMVLPHGYVSIVGPIQSGKSTILEQLRFNFEAQARPTVVAVVDLLLINSHAAFDQVINTVIESVYSATINFKSRVFTDGEESTDPVLDLEESPYTRLQTNITSFIDSLPDRCSLALVLENVDLSSNPAIAELLTQLRSIYDHRKNTRLQRFGVITTSVSSLAIDHGSKPSPFNIATEVRVEDGTPSEIDAFLNAVCEENSLICTEPARLAFHTNASGVFSIAQELLYLIEPHQGSLTELNVNVSIAKYFEATSRFSLFSVKGDGPSTHSRRKLLAMLQQRPIVRFTGDPAYDEIYRRGIIKDSSPLEFRCEIIRLLAAIRFLDIEIETQTSNLEHIIVQLPTVRTLLADSNFGTNIIAETCRRLKSEASKNRETLRPERLQEVLSTKNEIPIDLLLTQSLLERHCPATPPSELLEAIRSLLCKWYLQQNNAWPT